MRAADTVVTVEPADRVAEAAGVPLPPSLPGSTRLSPMLCPSCRKALLILEIEEVELDTCVDGHGLWFDDQELRQLFDLAGVPAGPADLDARLERLPHQGARRRCPRCKARMEQVQAPGNADVVILDRCPRGHGLWFDAGELAALLAALLGPEDAAISRVRDFLGDVAGPGHAALVHEPADHPSHEVNDPTERGGGS